MVGESLDSSIPHTLSDCDASALLLILSAEFLHSLQVSDAANASLKLVPENAGPIRNVDAAIIATMVKLTVDTFFFMVKLMLRIIL